MDNGRVVGLVTKERNGQERNSVVGGFIERVEADVGNEELGFWMG